MKQLLMLLTCFFLFCSSLFAEQEAQAPDYFRPLTPEDKENINYIVDTLSDKSAITLLIYQKNLEETGGKTRPIHPLKFLYYVFTDPTLRAASHKIRPVVWRRFVQGFEPSFEEEDKRNNLKMAAIEDFSSGVRVKKEKILSLLRAKKWSEFMNLVLEETKEESSP